MSAINDFGQFTTLRAEAVRGETGILREVAEQFEAHRAQPRRERAAGEAVALEVVDLDPARAQSV